MFLSLWRLHTHIVLSCRLLQHLGRGFNSSGWGASWCLPRCRWWGTFGCNAWTAHRPARWGTSRSSRTRRSCTPGSRWSAWGRSSETLRRRWVLEACPSGTQTGGGRPSRSRPSSQRAETWARSHFQDGHTSATGGSLHSCSSPAHSYTLGSFLSGRTRKYKRPCSLQQVFNIIWIPPITMYQ